MANVKEIKNKIASVQSTQKITKAMEMVAASKMRKTQETMSASRPYAETIKSVISHLSSANSEFKHPYMEERDVKNIGYIILSTDRGLCGGLNANLFKHVLLDITAWQSKGVGCHLSLIGSKAAGFFHHMSINVSAQVTGLGDNPTVERLIGAVKIMLKAYDEKQIDKLFIVHNKFINTMTQEARVSQLIPLPHSEDSKKLDSFVWDYLYEPDPKYLLDILLRRYIESQVYQGVVENLACEQAARMIAMKAATDNGSTLINDLQIIYNKVRQSSITNELIDIVSGANAVSS